MYTNKYLDYIGLMNVKTLLFILNWSSRQLYYFYFQYLLSEYLIIPDQSAITRTPNTSIP